MYNGPYFIPGYYSSMAAPSMMRGAMNGASLMRGVGSAAGAGRGLGLFGRLGNSMRALRALNWGGFINNASKTLGVINQAIPLVRQVGPMMNNMRSMLKVASIFKDETDKKPTHHSTKNTPNYQTHSIYPPTQDRSSTMNHQSIQSNLHATNTASYSLENKHSNSESQDGAPTFFIES